MSTAAQVDTAWLELWNHETIQAITPQIHQFAITELSEFETSKLYHGQEINFIQAICGRSVAKENTQRLSYEYTVEISYFRHKDTEGETWIEVRDFFDTLYSLVVSELGHKWGDTVDFWKPQTGPATITDFLIDEEVAWKGTYQFQGYKLA